MRPYISPLNPYCKFQSHKSNFLSAGSFRAKSFSNFLVASEARLIVFLTKKKNSTNLVTFSNPHTKSCSKRPRHHSSPGVSPNYLSGAPKGSSRHFLNLRIANAIFFLIICPHTKFQIHRGPGVDSLFWHLAPTKKNVKHLIFQIRGIRRLAVTISLRHRNGAVVRRAVRQFSPIT